MGAAPSNNKIKSSLMSTSSHSASSSPPFYLPPCLTPPPPLSLTSSAGSGANLRVRAMPTYSLRRARFNTSKCCNASQLTLIIKACASPVPLPLPPTLPRPPPSTPMHNAPGPGGVSRLSYLRRKTHSRSGHRRGSMLIVAS